MLGKYSDYPCPVTTSGNPLSAPNLSSGICDLKNNPAGAGDNGAGLQFPGLPEWQYTLGARYEYDAGWGMVAGQFDYTWTGKRTLNALNDITFDMAPSATKTLLQSIEAQDEAAFGLLNLHLDYTMPDHQFTVGLFATNLTGEQYATHSFWFNVPSSGFGLVTGQVHAPRMWGVTLRMEFGDE
jgi:outer membrane receptor protein involved in Fe transport